MASQKQSTPGTSHALPRLTPYEKLTLYALLLLNIAKALVKFTISLPNAPSLRLKPLKRTFLVTVSKSFSSLSITQLHSLQEPTGATITSLCAASNIPHTPILLPSSASFPPSTLHFIDCAPDAPGPILLYLHGGGYVFPMSAGHFSLARAAAAAASSHLAVLEYTLAPGLKYPGQLAQASAALRHLLKHRAASEITLGGDSGGGNLALAVLAHLRRPHARVEPVFAGEGEGRSLRGVFCISPRCSNVTTAGSFRENAGKDIVGYESMRMFTSNWEPVDEVWAAPVRGSEGFWEVVMAHRVLLLAGGDEVYRDDIRTLAGLMGAETGMDAKVVYVEAPGEVHVQCLLDQSLGIEDGIMRTALMKWLQG